MNSATRIVALLVLLSSPGFAGSWWGALVDARCYASEERNVNPTDTLTSVDRDGSAEIRYCSPTLKTKYFALVQREGPALTLDATGNAKAAEVVRQAGGTKPLFVTITGEPNRNEISVNSISRTK